MPENRFQRRLVYAALPAQIQDHPADGFHDFVHRHAENVISGCPFRAYVVVTPCYPVVTSVIDG